MVAALTLPTLIANYQKKQYVTQLKKSYTVIQNAFRTAMAEDGVDDLGDTELWKYVGSEEFYEKLSKYLNISTAGEHITHRVKYVSGDGAYPLSGIRRFADGSVFVEYSFYECEEGNGGAAAVKQRGGRLLKNCGNFYVDINSEKKGPNQFGRDVFYFALGADGMLYPVGGKDEIIFYVADQSNYMNNGDYWNTDEEGFPDNRCKTNIPDSMGYGCAARIMEENWEMNY